MFFSEETKFIQITNKILYIICNMLQKILIKILQYEIEYKYVFMNI